MQEYDRLWDCFEDTWGDILGTEQPFFPRRLDIPTPCRLSKIEPIGPPDVGNSSWLNASLQLLTCVEDVMMIQNPSNAELHHHCNKFFEDINSLNNNHDWEQAQVDSNLYDEIVTYSGLERNERNKPSDFFHYNQKVFNIGGHEVKSYCSACSSQKNQSFEIFNW